MARTIHMLSAVVESRVSGFLSGVERAKTATRDLRVAVSDFVNSVNSAGTRIAAGLTAATAGVTKMAFNFQTAMIPLRGVLAHLTDVEFAKFERGLRDLAIKTGRSVDELSKGANDFLQSGATADEALTAMASTVRLVVAGQAEMSSATQLVTNAVNAYGKSWSEVDRIVDSFFKSNDDGIGTIEEWAVAIPQFTSVASKMNVPLDTLLGQFASISKGTKSASVAATSLRAFQDAMASGQKELEQMFERWGGPEEAVRRMGLQDVAEHLFKSAGGSLTELQRLLGRKEAVTAIIEITGVNADRTRKYIERASQSAGESMRRMELAQNAPVEKFKQSWQAIRDVVLSVGAAVGDKVVELTKGIREFVESNKPEIVQQTVDVLGRFVEIGTSVVQFLKDHQAQAKEAAETFQRWFGGLLKFISESPRLTAALVGLKVAGFLGLTGVLRSFLALLATTGMSSLRGISTEFGWLRKSSKDAADGISADAAKQATARDAASKKTIGALLAERNAQIAAQAASAQAAATAVGKAAGGMVAAPTVVNRVDAYFAATAAATRHKAAVDAAAIASQNLATKTAVIGTAAKTGAARVAQSMDLFIAKMNATGAASTTLKGRMFSVFDGVKDRVSNLKLSFTSLGSLALKGGAIGLLITAMLDLSGAAERAEEKAKAMGKTLGAIDRAFATYMNRGQEQISDAKMDEDKLAATDQRIEQLKAKMAGVDATRSLEKKQLGELTGEGLKNWTWKAETTKIKSAVRDGIIGWAVDKVGIPTGREAVPELKQNIENADNKVIEIQEQIAKLEADRAKLKKDIAEKETEKTEATQQALIADLQQPGAIDDSEAIDAGPLNQQLEATAAKDTAELRKKFLVAADAVANELGIAVPAAMRDKLQQTFLGEDPQSRKSTAADTRLDTIQREKFDEEHPGAEQLRNFMKFAATDRSVSVDQVKQFATTLKMTDGAIGELTGRFLELRDINFEKPDQFVEAMLKLADDSMILNAAGKKADEQAKLDFEKQQQAKKDQEAAANDVGEFFKDIRQRAVASLEDLPDNAAAQGLRDKAEFFVEEFQNKAYVLEQSLANGSLSVDGFNRAMTDLRSEADQTAAALQREIDAEKRRRLLRGDFSLLDPRKALEDRILSFRMQQFNQGIDSVFKRMFPFADQLGKATEGFTNLNNGIQNFGNTLQNFGTIGAEKVGESWNQITSWLSSRAGEIASVQAQIQLLVQNLNLLGNNSFNGRGLQIRRQIDWLSDVLNQLMAEAPPTFLDTTGAALFNDPGLQTVQQPQTNNVTMNMDFPNINKLTNADARQILATLNFELQRAGHQRVF